AALLLLGYRAWPAIFIGAFLANVTTAGNVATSFAIATGNTLEALAGAWLVNRFAGGTNVFDRPQGVFKFALAAGISTIISPAFGVTSLGVAGFADWANYGAISLTWWLGDATGDLVFTPLVLLWSVASKRRWNKKEAAEVGALFRLLVLVSGVGFGGWLAVSDGTTDPRRDVYEVQQQEVDAVAADRPHDHFLAILSHKLLTPHTPVIAGMKSIATEPAQTGEDTSLETKSDLELEFAGVLVI